MSICNSNTIFNPPVSVLYQNAIRDDGLTLSSTGALLAYSGEKTGRCPKDKRIVLDDNTKNIWWGSVNIPIMPILFDHYKNYAIQYLNQSAKLYKIDMLAGWDPDNQIKIRLYSTSAYHSLFLMDL